jgi:phage-related protein
MFRVEPFIDNRGRDVIGDFLREVGRSNKKARSKIERAVGLLAENGFDNPDDLVRKVRGDLWELRATFQRNPYRVLFYNPAGQTFVLLAGFLKKTDAISEADIQRAERRMAEDRERRETR